MGREGFRLGLTKEIPTDETEIRENGVKDEVSGREQRVVNVSWLSVPTGALLSICALFFHLHLSQRQDTENEWEKFDYKLAGILYCFASFVESLAEPLVISCLQRLDMGRKAKAEGVALLAKGVSCFGSLYLTTRYKSLTHATIRLMRVEVAPEAIFSVTAFGVSQLVYALVFTMIMYRDTASTEGIQWPKYTKTVIQNPYKPEDGRRSNWIRQYFDLHSLHLVVIFTLQGVFKHALTEADKIVLSALAGSYDQGVYALASSYGGLAARLLLQPLEENARLLFSRQGALIARSQSTENGIKKHDEKKNDSSLVADLENTYCFLLRGVLYIGLVFASIATNYTSLLLRILAGSRWSNSEASNALAAFCVYTAFLALNGTTEAFVYGVARSGRDVGQLGMVHAIIGGIFASISPSLVRGRGAVGLVIANCICMGLRSMYSIYYASRYFTKLNEQNNRLGLFKIFMQMIPHPIVLGVYTASFILTRTSKINIYEAAIAQDANWLVSGLKHIGVGITCVVVIVGVSLYVEDNIRSALFKSIGRKTSVVRKKSLSQWYMNQLEKHELLTKSITAGILGIVGDVFAQAIEQHLDRNGTTTINDILSLHSTLDKQRTVAMFGDGLFTGPLLHYIYELYETLLPLPEEDQAVTSSRNISRQRLYLNIAHVVIDNTIMALLYVFLTMCTSAIFEGHYETIYHELRNDFFSAVKASWFSSIGLAPMQLLSFLYLPTELKVLAVNVQDIVWVTVISYATHLNRH